MGPVTLRPYVDVDIRTDFSANGAVQIELKKFASCKVGFNEAGVIFKNTTGQTGDSRCIHDLDVNGSLETLFKAGFKLGIGLYTKNVAVGIEPMIKVGPTVELDLTNANSWRLNPELHFKILGAAEGYCLVQLFGKELWTEQMELAERSFLDLSWPLLPQLYEGSLSVVKREPSTTLTFDGKYKISQGLLARFLQIRPGYKVFRAGEELMSQWSSSLANAMADSQYEFDITGLEHDIHYTCRPMLKVGGFELENDGTVFSSVSPTAAITEIVQTGTATNVTARNGYDYNYAFSYYVNSEIRGSAQCQEWGLYTPNAMFESDIYSE